MWSQVDVVVIGNLLIDELPGGVVEPGGAALYVSLAAARAGARVGLHSVVGEDYPLDVLRRAGVQLSLKRLTGPGGRTVIDYLPSGRTLSHVGPGHEIMTPRDPHPFEAGLVVLAPMPWERQLYHLDHCAPGSAFLDPYPTLNESRWRELRSRSDRLRFLVLNREELEMDLDDIPSEVPSGSERVQAPAKPQHRPNREASPTSSQDAPVTYRTPEQTQQEHEVLEQERVQKEQSYREQGRLLASRFLNLANDVQLRLKLLASIQLTKELPQTGNREQMLKDKTFQRLANRTVLERFFDWVDKGLDTVQALNQLESSFA